jgi:hypothetical protein
LKRRKEQGKFRQKNRESLFEETSFVSAMAIVAGKLKTAFTE